MKRNKIFEITIVQTEDGGGFQTTIKGEIGFGVACATAHVMLRPYQALFSPDDNHEVIMKFARAVNLLDSLSSGVVSTQLLGPKHGPKASG